MAHPNIDLMGAIYPTVPAVLLPKQGGGTAIFSDPSNVTCIAADVAEGKIFIAQDGSEQVGTSQGGGVDGDNLPYGGAFVGSAIVGTAIVM